MDKDPPTRAVTGPSRRIPLEFVFFDLGKTLLGDPREAAWQSMAASAVHGIPASGAGLATALSTADAEVDAVEFSHFFGEPAIASRALEIVGLSAEASLVRRLVRAYRRSVFEAYATNAVLRPVCGSDLQAILQRLLDEGLRLGIISNERRWAVRLYLTILGISRSNFAVIVTADDLGYGKPDPRIFSKAIELAGVRPELAAYVGDSIDKDMEPAARAGMASIRFTGLTTRFDAAGWEPSIDSLTDLEPLVMAPR